LELAQQVAGWLMDHSEMLEAISPYFWKKEGEKSGWWPCQSYSRATSLRWTDWVFLPWWRKVDWTQELPCFESTCRGLWNKCAVSEKNINHTWFPAISFLLTPTPRVEASKRKIQVLSALYKAFEWEVTTKQ
jgi:hypothetical protein